MIQFQENTQMSERKDGQTLFHGILPATARGLARKTAKSWHLKVKNIEYNVGLTTQKALKQLFAFLNLCHQAKNQFISSIHS